MRADRLLSILMLLQTRGCLTAQELAEELDVSERTIYRDMEALGTSGVPVYSDHGPGGGFALLDSYRTNLTGMTEDELRALFMVSVPAPMEKLGISQELRSALLKLSAALPNARRADEDQVHQRFHLDWNWWFHEEEPVPHLGVIQEAVWQSQCLVLTYRGHLGVMVEESAVNPYGLVAKAGVWYMVAEREGQMRVYHIANLTDVHPTGERFDRRGDFDLAGFWQSWCETYAKDRHAYRVRLRLSPAILPFAPLYFGHNILSRITREGPPEPDGWLTLTIPFESYHEARARILGMGGAVQVLEPEALRYGVIDFAKQALKLYGE